MNWKDFKYFTEDEFRPPGYDGEVSMSLGFMLKLEAMRSQLGSSFVIHKNGGFAVAGHANNSLHYAGLAADLHICRPAADGRSVANRPPAAFEPRAVVEQALLAWKWSFLSIGIYPFWKQPGLHLDDRTAVGLEKRVWFQDRDGKYRYYPYNQFHQCIGDLIRYQQEATHHEQTAHV